MKKMMFFLMALVLVVFTAGNSSAQGNKTQTCYNYEGAFSLPCVDEDVWGSLELCMTNWDGKAQTKFKGTFIGEESGFTYTYSVVQNTMSKLWVEGQADVWTDIGTATVECEGIPVAVTKLRAHFVANANGVIVLDTYEIYEWMCL